MDAQTIILAGPEQRRMVAHALHAAGHEVLWLPGLDGQPFPAGFRSSKMDKAQMASLIDWIYAYGHEHGVRFHVPKQMETLS